MTTTPTPNTCDLSLAKRRPRLATRPLSDYPELMTVAEAAGFLRIATSTAYTLANLHLEGIGQDCMPAIRVGGRIRIVRAQLATIFGIDLPEPGPTSIDPDSAR